VSHPEEEEEGNEGVGGVGGCDQQRGVGGVLAKVLQRGGLGDREELSVREWQGAGGGVLAQIQRGTGWCGVAWDETGFSPTCSAMTMGMIVSSTVA
jgi:hypothetical protein